MPDPETRPPRWLTPIYEAEPDGTPHRIGCGVVDLGAARARRLRAAIERAEGAREQMPGADPTASNVTIERHQPAPVRWWQLKPIPEAELSRAEMFPDDDLVEAYREAADRREVLDVGREVALPDLQEGPQRPEAAPATVLPVGLEWAWPAPRGRERRTGTLTRRALHRAELYGAQGRDELRARFREIAEAGPRGAVRLLEEGLSPTLGRTPTRPIVGRLAPEDLDPLLTAAPHDLRRRAFEAVPELRTGGGRAR